MNEFQKIVSDQVEGLRKTYTYSLPDNFKGILDLGFYTRLGLGSVSNAKSLDYDVILLDNLEIKTITSSDEESKVGKLVLETIPSENQLKLIGNTDGITSLHVINPLGQSCLKMENSVMQSIDISSLTIGYYFLQINFSQGKKQVLAFVKN